MHPLIAQQIPQELSPWLWVAAASVVVLVVLLIFPPRSRRQAPPAPRASEPSLGQQRAVERDMHSLMQELSELARRVGSQLDARGARLEQLIREADARIVQLHAPRSNHNGQSVPPAPEPGLAVFSDHPPTVEIDPRHAEIYTLQDQGLSLQQIADRLRRPQGEVELIVALRPRSDATH